MPTIAIVEGVALIIYPNDHPPPHVHASIAEYRCKIAISSGELIDGDLPKSKLTAVQAWLLAHAEEVSFAWNEIYSGRMFKGRIS